MGSVTRRFKRNIVASQMAEKVGITVRSEGYRIPLIFYRTLLLRTKKRIAEINRKRRHQEEKPSLGKRVVGAIKKFFGRGP